MNQIVFENQLKKMQARGKTCFLQHQQNLVNQNSKKGPQKKATEKLEVFKNQLKKCKLGVRRAFCNTQKALRTENPEKVPETQMKHTNTTTTSKCNLAPHDDDTRALPPTHDPKSALPTPCKLP